MVRRVLRGHSPSGRGQARVGRNVPICSGRLVEISTTLGLAPGGLITIMRLSERGGPAGSKAPGRCHPSVVRCRKATDRTMGGLIGGLSGAVIAAEIGPATFSRHLLAF